MSTHRRIGVRFYGFFAVVAVLSYLIHEAAHWVAGSLLGYPMSFGINSVIPGTGMTERDHLLMSAAGPAATVLLGLIAFALVLRRRSLTAYAVLYFALFMRVVAAAVSLFNPNDEARISQALGLGLWAVPAAVILILLIPTVIASRRLRLSWTVNALAYVVSSLVASAVVVLDMLHRGTL